MILVSSFLLEWGFLLESLNVQEELFAYRWMVGNQREEACNETEIKEFKKQKALEMLHPPGRLWTLEMCLNLPSFFVM